MQSGDRDRGVFVPAVMGAGLVFSLAVLALDSLERLMGRRTRLANDLIVAEVVRQTRGRPLDDTVVHDLSRRRRILAIGAATCLGVAAYVAPGALFNYLRPGGYLEEAAWVLALALGLAVIAGVSGVVLGISAVRPGSPMLAARHAWWLAEGVAERDTRRDRPHHPWGSAWHGTASLVVLGLGVLSALWTLAVAMNARLIQGWDDRTLDQLRAWDSWWGWAEPWGRTEVGVALGALAVTVLRRRVGRLTVVYLSAVVVGVLANVGLKLVIDRTRPPDPSVSTGLASYPSGHMIQATIASIFVTALVWAGTRRRVLTVMVGSAAAAMALISGLGRVTEAAHWPSDVVGGALVAALISAAGLATVAHPALATGRIPQVLASPTIAAGALRWAQRLVVVNVATLAILIVTVGVPTEPGASLVDARVEQVVQMALLLIAVVGLVLSWWSSASASVVILISGTGMAWFAALQYRPLWAMAVAVVFFAPAFLMWLSWQHGQTTRALVVLGVSAAVLSSAAWLGASAVHDRFFGPTHPESTVSLDRSDEVMWVWSGDLGNDRFSIVAQLRRPADQVRLVVSDRDDLAGARDVTTSARGADGRVVAATVTGLVPDTDYVAALVVDGRVITERQLRIRTAPLAGQSVRIAFGACAMTGSNGAVFDAIREMNPLLYLITGDAHYGDVATNDPVELRSVWDRSLMAPAQQALYLRTPVAYVWDDHDYGGNDSDAGSPARPAAQQVYREIVPHGTLAHADDVAQSFVVARVRVILTDTRSHRRPAADGSGTLLGDRQRIWLIDQLRAARDAGQLAIWVSPTPWIGASDPTSDTWAGFAEERRRLADDIAAERIKNLIMLSGDAHMAAIDDGTNSGYTSAGGPGFPVAHGGALDRPGSVKGGPYSEGAFPGGGQFGILDIDDDGGSTISVTVSGHLWNGDTLVRYTKVFELGTAALPDVDDASSVTVQS